jgi:hypothetical protein
MNFDEASDACRLSDILTIPVRGPAKGSGLISRKTSLTAQDSKAIGRRYHVRVRYLGNSRRDSTISNKGDGPRTMIELGLVEESGIFPSIVQG